MPTNSLDDYQKKIQELKAMAKQLETELVSDVTKYLKQVGDSVEKLKQLNPEFKVTGLADWESLTLKFGVEASAAPVKLPGKRGRPAKASGGNIAGVKKTDVPAKGNGKTTLTKSEQKVLDFIGNGEKGTKQIAKHIGTANISPTLSGMVKKSAIKSRSEGVKKFWSKA